jgi:site-specific recombinase XerC
MPRRKVMLLEEVLEVYYQDCRVQGYSPATITGYQRRLRCFLRWAAQAGVLTVSAFTGEAVKRYIAHVQQQPKWADNAYVPTQAERVSATTVRNYVRNYVRDLKAFGS